MSRIIPDGVPPCAFRDTADVVVIGGGIVGVSTAYFLAEKGVSVILCEKGLIGAEQSARNWGWVRQMGRDPAEIPLAVRSLALWREMSARTGADTGFRQTGISYICRNDREMADYAGWIDHARDYRIDTRRLDRKGLTDLLPGISDEFTSGVHTASDGRAEPWVAAPAIARAAIGRGAAILTGCAVRGIETSGGAVSGVVTEKGAIRCTRVVVAGGAWSRHFLGNIGVDIPVLKVVGSVARLSQVAGATGMPVGASDFAFRQREDGGFTMAARNKNTVPILPDSFRFFADFTPQLLTSWKELRLRVNGSFFEEMMRARHWALDRPTVFEKVRILDPEPNAAFLRGGLEKLVRGFPAFRDARIAFTWGGVIDVTPDAVPIMDEVARIPGLFVASGFSGHGFGIGPGSGELMARMVTGETPLVDAAPFRLARFARSARSAA